MKKVISRIFGRVYDFCLNYKIQIAIIMLGLLLYYCYKILLPAEKILNDNIVNNEILIVQNQPPVMEIEKSPITEVVEVKEGGSTEKKVLVFVVTAVGVVIIIGALNKYGNPFQGVGYPGEGGSRQNNVVQQQVQQQVQQVQQQVQPQVQVVQNEVILEEVGDPIINQTLRRDAIDLMVREGVSSLDIHKIVAVNDNIDYMKYMKLINDNAEIIIANPYQANELVQQGISNYYILDRSDVVVDGNDFEGKNPEHEIPLLKAMSNSHPSQDYYYGNLLYQLGYIVKK